MPGRLVPDRLTKYSQEELIDHVIAGYRRLMGTPANPADPSPECASVLGAQACLEGGNGEKIHCNNPGNKKKPADWDGDYCTFRCDEIFDGPTTERAKRIGPGLVVVNPWHDAPDGSKRRRVVLLPMHPWALFVAFETPEEGFEDWVATLAFRFRAAWERAFAGDGAGFVAGLATGHYMTADVDAYRKAVVSIAARLLPLCRKKLGHDGAELTDDDRAHIAAMVFETTQQSAEDALHGAEPFPLDDPKAIA